MRTRDRASAKGLLPRMEARPLKNGECSYRYHPVDGKPVPLGRDRADAIRKVLDMLGRSDDSGTFRALWRMYNETPEWKRLADSTKEQYRDNWKELDARIGMQHVSALRPRDVARYLRVTRASAPVVANREVAVLSNLCNLAVELGLIDRNPCKEVRRNREEARVRLVAEEELQAFVAWALKQGPSAVVLVSMAQFAALAGNRRAEFLKLHWPQVDDEVVRLTRAKQRGSRQMREVVELSAALKEVFDRMRAIPGYSAMGAVFRAPRTSNAYSESGFKAMWGRLMKKAISKEVIAERFTFHDLRGHYTTYYKRKFKELPELHADPKTTASIYERSREVRREAL